MDSDLAIRKMQQKMCNEQGRRLIKDHLMTLDEEERKIIQLRIGWPDTDPLTLKQVCERTSLARTAVRQRERSAIEKMAKLRAALFDL
jgi:DNA-directed RNA polymerase sigma subunit (sigma70/sigma32)